MSTHTGLFTALRMVDSIARCYEGPSWLTVRIAFDSANYVGLFLHSNFFQKVDTFQ
jgi:hypothetical protein